MNPAANRISLEDSHRILATFGITKPTNAYHRWVKEDGFDLKDFDAVLFESPFVFTIDWRAGLREELGSVAEALAALGIDLEIDLDEHGEAGWVSCGGARRTAVAYRPGNGNDLDEIFRSLQSVVPENIEFRSSPLNSGNDTAIYAVLPREEWAELAEAVPETINHFFQPL